jgi:CMP-N,N'-diacetyllegionaminic acid synthase
MFAIIPARGGSKGLPGKNIKSLLGKPLIAYTIEAAIRSAAVEEVIISTDDQEIADVCKSFGGSVPFMRPDHLATDDSPAVDSYLYTIDRLEKERGITIPEIMVLLPTCPLRTAEDIDNAADLYTQKQADSVVSYVEEHHPIYWHRKVDQEGRLFNFWDGENLNNRQAFEKTYYPNGAIYIFKTEILRQRKYYTQNSFAYIMPRKRSVDIDSIDDFELAEFFLKQYAS